MFGVASGSEIPAEAHGNGAGCDFRQASNHDDVSLLHGARQAGGQREGNSEAVGHANHNVTDKISSGEVFFNVLCARHSKLNLRMRLQIFLGQTDDFAFIAVTELLGGVGKRDPESAVDLDAHLRSDVIDFS